MLKSRDMDAKNDYAIKLYNKGDYYKALPLFEELITVYRGTKKAEQTQITGLGILKQQLMISKISRKHIRTVNLQKNVHLCMRIATFRVRRNSL